MSRVVKITESNLIKIIKNIIKEQSEGDDEYYDITPEQYYKLLTSVGNQAQAIPRLPMFKGKRVRVVGNLDLNGKPIKSLGELTVTGKLNIPYTKIENLNGVDYGQLGSYYSTPYNDEIERRRKQKEKNDADQRRIDDEWNLMDTDTEGEMAHAVFNYMVSEGQIDELSYPEVEELIGLKRRLKELEDRIEVETDADVVDELTNDYDELQYDIDQLEDRDNDVYGLIPDGTHWDMHEFRSIHDDTNGNRYAVGTYAEADRSLNDYYGDMIDDMSNNFDRNTLSYHIDGDEVAEYFEDSVREWVYNDPDNYDIKRDLSSYQEKEIKELNSESEELNIELGLIRYGILPPLTFVVNKDNNWEFTDGEGNKINYELTSDNNHTVYINGTPTLKNPVYKDVDWDEVSDIIEERISEIEERLIDIPDDIEFIRDNPDGDPDDDDVDEKVDEILEEIKDDPVSWLDNHGIEYTNFIDKDSLKRDLIDESGYGVLSSYDGTYDEITINDNTYIVFRID
jgi:hypothetical protein